MIDLMKHSEAADAVHSSEMHRDRFVSENGQRVAVLGDLIGRTPIKGFEVTLDATGRALVISGGVVQNQYFKLPDKTIGGAGKLWLSYRFRFATKTGFWDGEERIYRRSGPVLVSVSALFLGLAVIPEHENWKPDLLVNARLLAVVAATKAAEKRAGAGPWKIQSGGTGLHPIVIPALGGFIPVGGSLI